MTGQDLVQTRVQRAQDQKREGKTRALVRNSTIRAGEMGRLARTVKHLTSSLVHLSPAAPASSASSWPLREEVGKWVLWDTPLAQRHRSLRRPRPRRHSRRRGCHRSRSGYAHAQCHHLLRTQARGAARDVGRRRRGWRRRRRQARRSATNSSTARHRASRPHWRRWRWPRGCVARVGGG